MMTFAARQFRTQAMIGAIAVAAVAVTVLIVGPQVVHYYDSDVANCAKYSDCQLVMTNFEFKYNVLRVWLGVLVMVAPGLAGIFWGAPLVARELETGTFRLAWTQSVMRRRWLLARIGFIGIASVIGVGLLSLMVTIWASTLDKVNQDLFGTFDSRGIVPIGYALFGLATGVFAGAVVRRTLPAMVTTLVGFVAIRLIVTQWLRPRLVSPLKTSYPFQIFAPENAKSQGTVAFAPHIPANSWIVSQNIVNSAGRIVVSNGQLGLNGNGAINVGPSGVTIGNIGSCPNLKAPADPSLSQANDLVQRCAAQLRLREVVSYQPPSHYWPIQIEETLIFVAAAIVLGAASLWWVRRRLT
jgi:hypothetical protein